MTGDQPILFYDGDCGLCARSVQWCLRHDRSRTLRFAPLQGPTYQALPHDDKPADLETMVLLDERGLRIRSDAWIGVLRAIGGPWKVVGGAVALVPRPLRDAVYRFIARRRARFGPSSACALPTDAQAARFLA